MTVSISFPPNASSVGPMFDTFGSHMGSGTVSAKLYKLDGTTFIEVGVVTDTTTTEPQPLPAGATWRFKVTGVPDGNLRLAVSLNAPPSQSRGEYRQLSKP